MTSAALSGFYFDTRIAEMKLPPTWILILAWAATTAGGLLLGWAVGLMLRG